MEFPKPNSDIHGSAPLIWHFDCLLDLTSFYEESRLLVIETIQKHAYNSVSGLIQFYEDYKKKRDLSLQDFYLGYKTSLKDAVGYNCLGMSVVFKNRLLEKLSERFPFLLTHLYFLSSEEYLVKELHMSGIPEGTGQLKRHAALAIKFTLGAEARKGFILFEIAYSVYKPLIIMEDGESPHTGSFPLRAVELPKFCHFKVQEGTDFIKWCMFRKRDGEVETDEFVYRWFYTGLALIDLDELHKRNQVTIIFGVVMGGDRGISGGVYRAFKDGAVLNFLDLEHPTDNLLTVRTVPAETFLGDWNQDIEKLLNRTAEITLVPLNELEIIIRKWAKILLDEDYCAQWATLHYKMVDIVAKSFR